MARNNRFRRANSGLPGYDNLGFESFGHPASKAQPSVDAYGIDSEFGEGVRKGPYKSGPAPASYAWTPDHPAADDEIIDDFAETRDLYEQNLKLAMERKAAKCIEIAESRLGKTASQGEIEDLALRFMDLPSRQINAKLQSLASDFLAGDEMQDATGYEGEDVGPGNHMAEDMAEEMAEDSMAEDLAEEIAMLKAANARLTRQMRRLAEDVVQKETGHEGDDESVETLDSDESEGATKKLASEAMAEDMAILSEMMAEAAHMGDSGRMAEIMAEMDIVAKKYKRHNSYGEAAPGFGYQDPDVRAKNRANKDSDWNKKTKHFHNLNYYTNNKELWKKADFMAEDILSDEEFAEVMAEMDAMASEEMAGGPGSGGNSKGSRKVINQYGEAAPGFGYQDPDTRAQNRANKDSDWNKKTKSFYNKNYYSGNRGKIEGWPTPENPRVAEMEMAEDQLAAEEQAMLDEMLAEMESMANQNTMMATEDVAGDHMSGDHMSGDHMSGDHMSGNHMSGNHMSGDHMSQSHESEDIMGLDLMSGEEMGLDPKLARIFQAADEVAEESEASEESAEETAEEAVATKKSASFRPQTTARQASVKTLGNISREASSASDELSKLWESAPDVSKFFG